jgi:hypothetical protein
MDKNDLIRLTRDGDEVTFTRPDGSLLLKVVLPKGGVTMEEMERFIEHLKKIVKESNN